MESDEIQDCSVKWRNSFEKWGSFCKVKNILESVDPCVKWEPFCKMGQCNAIENGEDGGKLESTGLT